MASEPLTIYMGDIKLGRKQTYIEAAKREKCNSLSEWVKKVCDQAAGFVKSEK